MKAHDDIHAEMFARINALESKVDETNGYLRGVVESNEKLIKLFTKALYIVSSIALISLGAVIYGAIGEKGLHSVRQMTGMYENEFITAHSDDLDKWLRKLG